MESRKLHISQWLLLAIVAMLMVGCLIMAAGISLARYRPGAKGNILFRADPSAQVVLGSVKEGAFSRTQNEWQSVEGQLQLQFAVANGSGANDYAMEDQIVTLRLIGSMGAWDENNTQRIRLTVGEETFEATAVQIKEGTALHTQFGDGWMIRFLDNQGNEKTWELAGQRFSYLQMQLSTVDGDASLLQIQAIGEVK